MKAIRRYFGAELQERIRVACELAEKLIFEKGLLTKEPGLCHGATGNALALPSPEKEHFMAYSSAEVIKQATEEDWYLESDDPYGLFGGEAGRAWGWLLLDSKSDKGMIGYTDL